MIVRSVLLAGLTGALLGFAQVPQLRSSMVTPWYVEALSDILKLEQDDAARLEQRLAANPEDLPTRLKLLSYYKRGDRINLAGDRARRVQSVLWLLERHPDSELLHFDAAHFKRTELTDGEYGRMTQLWDTATRARAADAAVQWNAATFFENLDAGRHLDRLEATVQADPNHGQAIRSLASFYALSIFNNDAFAARSQAVLDASRNVWTLGNAAYVLQSHYNRSVQLGQANPRAAQLAERYFLRALALDPNLNRKTILPPLPQQSAPTQEVRQAAPPARRLPVDAFNQLPQAVAGVLRARNCTVPQPSDEGARNVIRGEFFAPGESGWAVYCSVNGSTTLLVFRNDRDASPQEIVAYEDGTPREISAVNRDFIMEHYRAHGGAEPPPITHQGINDAFVEKASVVWYFHEGKWYQLQGAD